MGRKTLIAIAATGCVALLASGVSGFIQARNTASVASCVNNLRLIDAAKQQWALEAAGQRTPQPAWEDLRPYLGRIEGTLPACPEGGRYQIGTWTNLPACSLSGSRPGHALSMGKADP